MLRTIGFVARRLFCLGVLPSLCCNSSAAVIAGRVVDGDGRPVAGAEVRIWQKMPGPTDQTTTDQPVRFADGDGGEVLRTGADGRFETPDVVSPEAFARVFVDADGMLTARGDWIEIRQETSPAPIHVVMRRLRIVEGRVIDREGRPIEGATVFHVGDAPEKLVTQTDRAGKFQLPLVPEGRVFIFAEKPGYRFTGVLLADDRDAALTLARTDEHVEPLTTLPPLLPHEEELAMVRELVERAYEVARSGSLEQKRWVLLALAQLDPVGTFDRAEALSVHGKRWRELVDNECTMLCIAGRGDLSRDNLRTFIELSDNHTSVASNFCDAADRMGDDERTHRLEWLDEALLHARSVDDAFHRARALARVAEGFALADQRQRAAEIVAEAEKVAAPLRINGLGAAFLYEALASAQACLTPHRAREWLERIGEARVYQRKAGELAVRLLPEHPDDALAVWQSAHERAALRKPLDFDLHGWEMANIADLCFRLTTIDRARAERLARNESFGPTRMRGLGGVALALSRTDAKAGRQFLASVVRDELPRLPSGEAEIPRLEAPPITAAWLLPIAERIDPELAHECFWRSLALRRPRSGREDFDDVGEEPDTELAKMLARYDREVARALLEPMAARVQQIAAPLATLLNARHAISVKNSSHRKLRYTVLAAALIDPRWAVERIATLPRGADPLTACWPLHCLASVVSPPYDERWIGEVYDAGWINYGAFGAGYWDLPTGGANKRQYRAKLR